MIWRWLRQFKLPQIGMGFVVGIPLGILLGSQSGSAFARLLLGLVLGIAFEIMLARYRAGKNNAR